MTLPNHIAGGLTFTGLIGSFVGINILENPSYIVLAIFAAVLPDIDHTKSIIGKMFYPFAKWINRHYGHRTITHTLLFLVIGTLIVGIIQNNFTTDKSYATIFFIAFLSHLILDMMTIQGVPLFFPFVRNPCVLPANPQKRFRTGNLRTETMWFSIFLLLGCFCYPLMKNGFWMQYNRSFGTLTHLAKQYKVSENVLIVDYKFREGSYEVEGKGYCLEASENEAIIFSVTNNNIIELKSDLTALKVYPTETNKLLSFKTESFINASFNEVDQLMKLRADECSFKLVEISSNKELIFNESGIHNISSNYSKEYPHHLKIQEIPSEQILPFKTNPRISQLSKIIVQKKQLENVKYENYERQLQQLQNLYSKLETTNLSEKERLIKEIKTFERGIKKPTSKDPEIKELEFELSTLRQTEAMDRQRYNEENKTEALQLTGTITKIIIK